MTMPRETTSLYSFDGFFVTDTTLLVCDDDTLNEHVYEESFNIYRKDSGDCFSLEGYIMLFNNNTGFIRLYNDDITQAFVETYLNISPLFSRDSDYSLEVTYFRKNTADIVNITVNNKRGEH